MFSKCCIKAHLSRREKCGRKSAQAAGMTTAWKGLSGKGYSNVWGSFTRSGLRLESVHQEPETNVRSIFTWAVEKNNCTVAQWFKVLFSDESKFYISIGNQGPSLEEEWWGTETLLAVQCEISTGWCWSTVFSEVHSQRRPLPRNFSALHASFCWQAL